VIGNGFGGDIRVEDEDVERIHLAVDGESSH
jgi:hypothetical protein